MRFFFYLITVIYGEYLNDENIHFNREPSGDKLASKVIKELKKTNKEIEYLCVGGENLKTLGIKSVYDLKDITYIGFTSVISNIFKINKKINETVKIITEFEPDILFTVDSPDFTLRVAEKVKKF